MLRCLMANSWPVFSSAVIGTEYISLHFFKNSGLSNNSSPSFSTVSAAIKMQRDLKLKCISFSRIL